MKKLFLAALALTFCLSSYAQRESGFGVKAGVNFAKLTGDDVEDADGRTGFHIGALYEMYVSDNFMIQPELVYSQQGLSSDEGGFDSKLKLDYLNIPIMAKFYVTEDFAIEAGPQIGILLSGEAEVDGTEFDVKDNLKGSDIGFGGGVSYNMETGLMLQARYMFGVSDVNDPDDENTFGDNLTNSVLSLSVGYKF